MPVKPVSPPKSISPLKERPGFLIRRLNQIHYAIFYEECGEFCITPVQHGMLDALIQHPGLDQKALGHELGLDRTNTADVLKRLEARGLVKRVLSKTDGRAKLAYITDEGRNIIQAMSRSAIYSQERLVEPLSPADRKKFIELARALVDANNEFGRASMRSL